MRFLQTLFACCAIDEFRFKDKNNRSSTVSLIREKNIDTSGGGDGGKTGGKNGRPPVQWRPSLCTIYEDDVVKTKRIQVYVPSFASSGYKHEFVLQGSWDMASPVSTSFLF